MPRDGLQQYAPPPGTQGIPNYTVESARYNAFVADITADQNNPRPIVAGGTGAANARDAMTSLQGDVAYQVVTNYDAYPFISGSFYSAAGATAAPTANAFIGTCYSADPAVAPPAVPASANLFIEARDVTTGIKYLRQKIAGVWAAWKAMGTGSTADLDAAYVNVTGDTMTGSLTIAQGAINSTLILNATNAGASNAIRGQRNGLDRWVAIMGNATAESGGNVGTDFQLTACNDAGTVISSPFNIYRATGNATFSGVLAVSNTTISTSPTTGALTVAGGVGVGGAIVAGGAVRTTGGAGSGPGAMFTTTGYGTAFQAGAASPSNWQYAFFDSAAAVNYGGFSPTGDWKVNNATVSTLSTNGALVVAGGAGVAGAINAGGRVTANSVMAAANTTDGAYYFGSAGTSFLSFSGGVYQFANNAAVYVANGAEASAINTGALRVASGGISSALSYYCGGRIMVAGGVAANQPGVVNALGVGFAGGGTQYGMAMRPITDTTIAIAFFNSANTQIGSVSVTASATSFVTSSDANLKENLKSFDAGNIVDDTNVYNFTWKATGGTGYGVIAQEAIEVYPDAVTHNEKCEAGDEFWGVDYSKYVPVLLQELKALRARVAQLEGRLDAKPA